MTRLRLIALTVAVTLAVLVLGSAPAHADTRVTLTFKAQLANVSNNTSTYGALQYGTTTLQGASLVNGEEVLVRRDSVVEYTAGSGPIGGFLTVTWKDGSRLSMRVSGTALTDTAGTDFTASLAVFDAAGRWKGYAGQGVMRGSRSGTLGAAVTYTYRLTLAKRG